MENLLYFFRKPAKYQNDDNFCKIHANDFILGHKLYICKGNISWQFGENPTTWRHFMTDYVIFLYIPL